MEKDITTEDRCQHTHRCLNTVAGCILHTTMIGIRGEFLYHLKDFPNSDDLIKQHVYFPLKRYVHVTWMSYTEIIDIIVQQQILASALHSLSNINLNSQMSSAGTKMMSCNCLLTEKLHRREKRAKDYPNSNMKAPK